MNIYHIWCNLKQGIIDLEFIASATQYLDHLKQHGDLIDYRIMRRKLGLGPPTLGEFHLMLEFADLSQLDNAFSHVASRADPVESFHHAVNAKVSDVTFALYRDFPDSNRETGQEKF